MLKSKKYLFITALTVSLSLLSTQVYAKQNVKRLAGQTRYDTCNQVVSEGWTKADNAIIVNSQMFADAITSAPLAKKYNAPILLTDKDNLTETTKEKLKSLGVKNVFIIGGQGVVSDNVNSQLGQLGITTQRLFGQNRYETSLKVAEAIGTDSEAFVVDGNKWEDALSIASMAANSQSPIILVDKNSVPGAVLDYSKKYKSFNIVGDNTFTSNNNIISKFENYTIINGDNALDINLKAVKKYSNKLKLNKVYFASSKTFADALSASALASVGNNPIILVDDSNTSQVNQFLKDNANNITDVNILGGTGAISDEVKNNILNSDTTVQKPQSNENYLKDFKNNTAEAKDALAKYSAFVGEENFKIVSNIFDQISSEIDYGRVDIKDNVGTIYLQKHSYGPQGAGTLIISFNKNDNSKEIIMMNINQFSQDKLKNMLIYSSYLFPKANRIEFLDNLKSSALRQTAILRANQEDITSCVDNGTKKHYGVLETTTSYGSYTDEIEVDFKKINTVTAFDIKVK